MAVTKASEAKSLKLYVSTGTNANGDQTFATRTIGGVKPSASNDDLYAVAENLGALQSNPVEAIKIAENYSLLKA